MSNTKIITPYGEAITCFIDTPSTKYDDRGTYNISIALDKGRSDVQDLMKQLDIELQTAKSLAEDECKPSEKHELSPNLPYKDEYSDESEPTGRIIIKMKQVAKGKTKDGEEFTRTIAKYDASGSVCNVNVGNGSVVHASFTINHYYVVATQKYGVSKFLEAIQIVDLVAVGSNGSPFEACEGFRASKAGSAPATYVVPEDDFK